MSDKDILSLICGILKNGTNELIYKRKVESQMWKTIMVTRGETGKINWKIEFYICVCSVTQSCLTLCGSMDCSLPGFSVHGDSPDKNIGWIVMPSSRGSSQPRDQTQVLCTAGGFSTFRATGEAQE